MQIIRLTFLFALVATSAVFSQQGWVVETINPAYNLEVLSYVDTNICQLIQKYNIAGTPIVIVSTNRTASWNEIPVFGYGIKDAQFRDAAYGVLMRWAHNDITLMRTYNSGLSWGSSVMITIAVSAYDRLYFSSQNSGFIWGSFGIIRTTNWGANWNSVSFNPVTNFTKMYFTSQDTGFLSGTNSVTSSPCVAKTTNFGTNWLPFDISNSVLKIDFVDANTGYAVCNGSQYIKTTNQGVTWQVNTITPTESLISLSFVNGNTGYLLSQSLKILKTTDGGASWITQNLPQSGVSVRDVEFASVNRGIILCSGGKIMKTTTGGEILGIQAVGNNIPKEFGVSQNYPNPFNPSTQIRIDITRTAYVRLVVYDQLGREIEQLVNNELNPGSYEYDWNASGYPSGIYFYKLQAGEFVETKKMILVK
ncbi:MAG: T9SS type A sorting domain-containing protein [Ignavibacteria bacterium]|nr:T9SS type A sorting domain-containing protein [Ignavibacteria bacterium]